MRIWRDDNVDTLTFYVNGKDIDTSDFKKKEWDLPGIKITSSIDPSLLKVKKIDSDEFSSDFEVNHNLDTIFEIKCYTNEVELTINHEDSSENGEFDIIEFFTSPLGLVILSGIGIAMVVGVVMVVKKKKEEDDPM